MAASLPATPRLLIDALLTSRRRVVACASGAFLVTATIGVVATQARADIPTYGPLTSRDAGEAFTDGHSHLIVNGERDTASAPAAATPATSPQPTAAPGRVEVPVALVDGKVPLATIKELTALGTVAGMDRNGDGTLTAIVDTHGTGVNGSPGSGPGDGPPVDPVEAALEAVPGTIAVTRIGPGTYSVVTDADPRTYEAVPGVAAVSREVVAYASSNDTYWDRQWSLENTGSTVDGGTPGKVGADIGVVDAWRMSTGAGQVVAVIDSGIDVGHPDLARAIWRNPAENCGNNVDDDHNGYVDDCAGWDFANHDNGVYDPAVYNDHGTHVAGIIAAAAGNGEGIAGIAPDTRVMALKAGDSKSFGFAAITEAIYYAVNNGATIISGSFGTQPGAVPREWLSYTEDAIAYARSKGVLCVFAAGNDATDIDSRPVYPASLPQDNIISVGASNSRDGAASFSNFGRASVDLFAPGSTIASTMPRNVALPPYAYMSGTSMATPEVAAAGALWWSAHRAGNFQELKAALMSSDGSQNGFVGKAVSGHRLDIGQLLDPGDDGVSFAVSDLAGARAGTPLSVLVHVSVSDDIAADHDTISYRATLLQSWQGQAYGVIEHPVTTDYGPTATDDQAAVNLGTYSRIVDPTLSIGTKLAAGSYALVVEAYDTRTAATIGRPWAAYFVVSPPGATTPPDPYDPPAPPPPAPGTPTTTTSSTTTTRRPDTPSTAPGSTFNGPTTTAAPPTTAPGTPPPNPTLPVTTTTTWSGNPLPTTTTTTVPETPTTRPAPPTTKTGPFPTTTTTWRSPTTQPATPPTTPTTVNPGPPTTILNTTTTVPTPAPTTTSPPPQTTPTLPPAPPSTANGALVLSSVTPAYGSTAGEDLVTIRGAGFTGNAWVLIGGVPARSVSVISPTLLRVVTPPHVPGTVGVTVAIASGVSATLDGAFTYQAPDNSGTVPPPGSPVTTTTTVLPTTTTWAASTTTSTTMAPVAPTTAPPSTAPTTVSPPAPDPAATRFTFGPETSEQSGQRLRPVVNGPAGLADPASWSSTMNVCSSPTCATFRL